MPQELMNILDLEDSFEVKIKSDILKKIDTSVSKVIVLVSNEYESISKNGGIGTYYTALSQKLAEDGWYVILIACQIEDSYQGDSHVEALKHIFAANEAESVLELSFLQKQILSTAYQDGIGYWFDWESWCCLFFVQAFVRHFNTATIYVEFPAIWGFSNRTIQGKQSGLLGDRCLTAVTTHGSFEWLREINRSYIVENYQWMWQAYANEQFAYEEADLTFFPSYFLMEKEKSYGWRAPHAKNLPYFIPKIDLVSDQPKVKTLLQSDLQITDQIPIIFFGRLEERKGLRVFVEGLKKLHGSIANKVVIIFLGKVVSLESPELRGMNSLDYIQREFGEDIPFHLYTDLYSTEAIQLINQLPNPIVCLTSLQENFPNTALEMGQLPVSIVASDTGGFRETLGLLNRSEGVRWFEPGDSLSFSKAISSTLNASPEQPMVPDRRFFDQVDQRLLQQRMTYITEKLESTNKLEKQPSVTVGIVWIDCDEMMSSLQSLVVQTYSELEVLVLYPNTIDTTPQGLLGQAKDRFSSFTFVETDENLSLGQSYNHLIEIAQGEYFLPFSAGTEATSFMLEKFVEAVCQSNSDIVMSLQVQLGETFKFTNLLDNSLLKLLELNQNRDISLLFRKSLAQEFKYSEVRDLQAVNWHLLAAAIATGKIVTYYPYPLYGFSATNIETIDKENFPKERYYLRQYLSQIDASKWSQRQINLLLSGAEQLLQLGNSSAPNHELEGALEWQRSEAEKWKNRSKAWFEAAQLMQSELDALKR